MKTTARLTTTTTYTPTSSVTPPSRDGGMSSFADNESDDLLDVLNCCDIPETKHSHSDDTPVSNLPLSSSSPHITAIPTPVNSVGIRDVDIEEANRGFNSEEEALLDDHGW